MVALNLDQNICSKFLIIFDRYRLYIYREKLWVFVAAFFFLLERPCGGGVVSIPVLQWGNCCENLAGLLKLCK